MAEAKEVRHAGIGLDLNMNGLDDFKRANSMMDDFLETMKEASRITDKFKNNFSGFGGKSSDEFRKTRDAVQDVYRSMDSAKNETNQATENVRKMHQEFEYASDAAKKIKLNSGLNSEINKTRDSIKDVVGQLDSAKQGVSKSTDSFSKMKKEIENTKDAAKTLNGSLNYSRDINKNKDPLNSMKESVDKVKKTTDKTTSSFSRLKEAGSKLANIGSIVATAMLPVAAAFKKSADEATDLQNRYITIRNLLYTGGESSKAVATETKAMQKENNGFALKYGVSPVDMAKGGEELIRRGYNGKQELGAHEYFLQAAIASGDPYLSVVGNAAPALESFGYKNRAGNSVKRMKDYTKLVTNQMAYASDLSATNFSGMGEALKYASQVAHSAHESLASTTAAIGIMSNRGLDGSIAGTGLRKVINSFASPDHSQMSQQEPIMEKYHINQSDFYNKNGQLKSLPELLDYINHQTRNLTSSKKDDFARKFFGTPGQQAGLDLMELVGKRGSNSANTLRGLTRRVGNAQNMYGGEGYEGRLAKKNMKSWQNQIKQFKQYFNVMGMGFTKTVLPAFTKVLGYANKLLDVLIKLPAPVKTVAGFVTAIGSGLAALVVTSKLFKKAVSFIFTSNGKSKGAGLFGKLLGKSPSKDVQKISKDVTKGGNKLPMNLQMFASKDSDVHGIKKITETFKSLGSTLAGRVSKGISVAKNSFRSLFTFLKSNPFILITAAVVALGVELYKHDKKFRKFVNGIISWAGKLVKGVVSWFEKMTPKTVKALQPMIKYDEKVFSQLWNDVKRIFKDAFKVIENIVNIGIDVLTGNWKGLRKGLVSLAKSLWSLVKSVFKGAFDYLNDLTGGRLGKMIDFFKNAWKDIGKDWKDFWNGIDDWFSNLWKGIVKHVQNGINDIIKVLNDGIGLIDGVIHMFGGSSTAIGKIGYVHFANGTGMLGNQRHEITKPTLAMLNDGHDSPETGNREMLIHPNGMSELIKGTNVKRLLEPGAEILNASETKFALSLNGMSHFAKGTGLLSNLWNGAKSIGSSVVGGVEKGIGAIGGFAGGILKATKKVFDTVKSIIKDPSKYLTGLLKKPSGKGTVLSDFANGFFGKMKASAANWWKSLWGMVNLNGGSGGDATGLLAAVEKYGRGKRYVWGAAGPNTFDCSGLVMYALKHSFGIDYPHFSGAQYSKTKHISRSDAKPGDLVFWGPGKHVGVFAGGNKYWSAFAPNGHPDIGIHSISGSVPGYSPLFGEVKGLARKTVSKGKKSATNSIQSLIKKQVGSGFFKFMSKLADKFGDNGDMGAVGLAGDESQRAREIAKALKQAYPSATDAGIAGILGNWMQESRLSPSAIDSADHGTGLGQWTFGRETGLRNWEKKHGYAWNSAKGQLEYALHEPGESGAFKAVLRMTNPAEAARKFFAGWESGGNEDATGGTRISNAEAAYKAIKGHAKGGRINKDELSVVNEKGWELFKPDTGGLMIPHEASEKIINGQNKKVSIDARTNLTIQGHADSSTINKIDERIEKRNNDLVEKMRQLLGSNDEGGLTV